MFLSADGVRIIAIGFSGIPRWDMKIWKVVKHLSTSSRQGSNNNKGPTSSCLRQEVINLQMVTPKLIEGKSEGLFIFWTTTSK